MYCNQFKTPREVFKIFLEIYIPYYLWKQKENRNFSCLPISLKKYISTGEHEGRDGFTYHIFLIAVWTEITWYNCCILKQYFIDRLGGKSIKCIQLSISSYAPTIQLNANHAYFSFLFQLQGGHKQWLNLNSCQKKDLKLLYLDDNLWYLWVHVKDIAHEFIPF